MVKMALKISYIGSNFSGSQIQSSVRTVEGVLLDALLELGLAESAESANITFSGRTDSGVHALSQVVTFNTNDPGLSIPRAINSKLPNDVWAWAYAIVPDDFNPRKDAISRLYRYYLVSEKYDISKMREAARLLVGTHDFSNFSKKDKKQDRSSVRTIEKLDIRVSGELIKIDITANSFLWFMVRKIVRALIFVGDGIRDVSWISEMLNPESHEEGIESAPAYGLALIDVVYDPAPEWIEDGYSIKRANELVTEEVKRYKVMSSVMSELLMENYID